MSQRPIMRVTYRRDDTTYSVLSVWPGKFPGSYSISRDKPTEKYPAISLVEVIKAWAVGNGFVNVTVESQREQRDSGKRGGSSRGDYSDAQDPVDNSDDLPF